MKNETLRLGKSVGDSRNPNKLWFIFRYNPLCTHFANIGPAIMAVGNVGNNEYKSTF